MDFRVIHEDGKLAPAVSTIVDLVAEHDAVLATGHVWLTNTWWLPPPPLGVCECSPHTPASHMQDRDLTLPQCRALVDLDVTLELAAFSCMGTSAGRPLDDIVATIKAVGPEHCTLATDYGQAEQPPARGRSRRRHVDVLWEAGLSERNLRLMACDNPQRLLRLA